jgi:hypothetical protein
MSDPNDADNEAPGWDAIDRAVTPLYPGQEPKHYGTLLNFRIGGRDPLDGISAYRAGAGGPRPHWHFVSYGMSDLYAKEGGDPEWSGWGFEFTFRLARDPTEPADAEPPMWALSFLQNLARYVFSSGNVFEPGHHMDLNGPIALEQETAITAALFASDPQLPEITTPHGRLRFVQVVGITADELEAARAWDTAKFIQLLGSRDPLLITDLSRQSLLRDSGFAAEAERGARTDGSSTAVLYADNITWTEVQSGKRLELTIGAKAVDSLKMMLAGRIPFGRPFALQGPKTFIGFEPADAVTWEATKDHVTVHVPTGVATQLVSRLRVKQGSYPLDEEGRVVVHVVPSRIKDAAGNVVAVIGE